MNEQSIFIAALEHDTAERGAYLELACEGDPVLLQRVQKLLAAHEEAASFMGQPAGGLMETTAPSSTEQPHTRIGRYKLLDKIGEGGMGVVYMAEQIRPVARRVALKIIKPGMDTHQVIARFEAERQALAMMDHPNISKVFDAGATDNGRPYFVMELVKGVSITEYCDKHQLTTRKRLELFMPVCHAVQHAHQKGIIHRDIKPSNVLVAEYDDRAVPKIIDFGIAKAVEQRLTEKTIFTRLGQVVGTVEYMSPEQAKLNQLDVDTRSDIYSLGAVLYELLTGETPFDRVRLRSTAFDEILRIIREEDPQKPSLRLSNSQCLSSTAANRCIEPTKLSSLVRGELDWIVMKALEKDRTRRYETSSSLAEDIRRYLKDEPVVARPASASYQLAKFVKRNRALVGGASVLFLAMVFGIVGTTIGMVAAHRSRQTAESREAEATQARQAAVEAKQTAEKARQEESLARRRAEQRLADGKVAQANAFLLVDRVAEARTLCYEAREVYDRLDVSAIAADLGLWHAEQRQPSPYWTFRGHHGRAVHAVTFRPDGRTAVSVGWDKKLRLWDLVRGKLTRTFPHAGNLRCLALSPDGRTALAGGVDKILTLWDLESGQEIRTLTGHTDVVRCVAISSDGRTALSGSRDKTLKLWNLATGEALRTFTGHDCSVWCVAISRDGQTALSSSCDNTMKLWDVAQGREIRTFGGHGDEVRSVAFSPDEQTALSACGDGRLRLWDIASGNELRSYVGHADPPQTVTFSSDGCTALSAGYDGKVKLWEVSSTQQLRSFVGHDEATLCATFSPCGRTILTGGGDGMVKLWLADDGNGARTIATCPERVLGVAFSPDGRTALAGGRGKAFKLRDVATGKELCTFSGYSEGVNDVAFSPNGQTVLAAGIDRTVYLWDSVSGKQLQALQGHRNHVTSVAFSPDGLSALSGSRDGTAKLWNLAEGREIRSFDTRLSLVLSVAFCPDGRTALTSGMGRGIQLWNVADGTQIRKMGNDSLIYDVAVSHDGQTALSAHHDKGVKLWDLNRGELIRTFSGDADWVKSVAFSPDDRTAVSGGRFGMIKLWDLAHGTEAGTIQAHESQIWSVAFSPDGHTLLSGSEDNTARICDLSIPSQYRELRRELFRTPQAVEQRHDERPEPPADLAVLGRWQALRGLTDWAIETLEAARTQGIAVSSLTLARCYWKQGRLEEARREFQRAIDGQEAPDSYLKLCLHAANNQCSED